jgi:ribonuclease P protein component
MNCETDVSTQPTRSQAPARFPGAHGNQWRPQGVGSSAGDGAQAPDGVNLAVAGMGRLLRRSDFLRVAASRQSCSTAGLVVQVAPSQVTPGLAASETNVPRVGYTASRKVGGAVERNRAKRRLRAAAAAVLPSHAALGNDYVLIARTATLARPFAALCGDLEASLRKLGAWRQAAEA